MAFNYCPQCAKPLQAKVDEGVSRQACPDEACGYVHWDNPTPVVAAVVAIEAVITPAPHPSWPVPFYPPIPGFLEKTDPSPEEAVAREVQEELGLQATGVNFIGHYVFPRLNQIIIAYHVPAAGEIVLNEELVDYKRIEPAKARYWPSSTGLALRDWLIRRGHTPVAMDLPKLS